MQPRVQPQSTHRHCHSFSAFLTHTLSNQASLPRPQACCHISCLLSSSSVFMVCNPVLRPRAVSSLFAPVKYFAYHILSCLALLVAQLSLQPSISFYCQHCGGTYCHLWCYNSCERECTALRKRLMLTMNSCWRQPALHSCYWIHSL
jgi:hypothetical protein